MNLHVLHFLHPALTVRTLRGHKSYGTCTEPAPALAPGEMEQVILQKKALEEAGADNLTFRIVQ